MNSIPVGDRSHCTKGAAAIAERPPYFLKKVLQNLEGFQIFARYTIGRIGAKYDVPDCQGTELVAALGRLHAADVTTISMDTDYPFSDHRIALEKEILNWLQPRTSPSATAHRP
jgi:hypothetical protein